MKKVYRTRYESIPKRTFKSGIVQLLETEYKFLGSHKVLDMIAEDIVALHEEYYPDVQRYGSGHLIWTTTSKDNGKASYGKKTEDYKMKTVLLPLITKEDVEARMVCRAGKENENYIRQERRDIRTMVRLVKSAKQQGGVLSGAELSVMMNRSVGTIGKYLKKYHAENKEILPTKGMVFDQGSMPTHKGIIINLYEQGIPEVDIARLTTHNLESVGRYIKNYNRIKMLIENGFGLIQMERITGMGRRTVYQYQELVLMYHPELKKKTEKKGHPEDFPNRK